MGRSERRKGLHLFPVLKLPQDARCLQCKASNARWPLPLDVEGRVLPDSCGRYSEDATHCFVQASATSTRGLNIWTEYVQHISCGLFSGIFREQPGEQSDETREGQHWSAWQV